MDAIYTWALTLATKAELWWKRHRERATDSYDVDSGYVWDDHQESDGWTDYAPTAPSRPQRPNASTAIAISIGSGRAEANSGRESLLASGNQAGLVTCAFREGARAAAEHGVTSRVMLTKDALTITFDPPARTAITTPSVLLPRAPVVTLDDPGTDDIFDVLPNLKELLRTL